MVSRITERKSHTTNCNCAELMRKNIVVFVVIEQNERLLVLCLPKPGLLNRERGESERARAREREVRGRGECGGEWDVI